MGAGLTRRSVLGKAATLAIGALGLPALAGPAAARRGRQPDEPYSFRVVYDKNGKPVKVCYYDKNGKLLYCDPA